MNPIILPSIVKRLQTFGKPMTATNCLKIMVDVILSIVTAQKAIVVLNNLRPPPSTFACGFIQLRIQSQVLKARKDLCPTSIVKVEIHRSQLVPIGRLMYEHGRIH